MGLAETHSSGLNEPDLAGGDGVRRTTLHHRSQPSANALKTSNKYRLYFRPPPPVFVSSRPKPCYFWGPYWGLENGE